MNRAHSKRHGAVIVTRVSTGEQVKHGTSLESQLETCRVKAVELRLPIVAEYEDAGVSGALLLSREGMQAALADIRDGRADTLITANISRLSRDVMHQQDIRRQVEAVGGRVVFCDLNIDLTTPEGDLTFGIFGSFSQYERMLIRDRTMRGRKAKAAEGIQTLRSLSPYGYHIVSKADVLRGTYPADQLGHYIVMQEQAAIVRRMFACVASGTHSMPMLSRDLNAEGVPAPKGGLHWRSSTIRSILSNPAYKGTPTFGRTRWTVDENRLLRVHQITGEPIRCVRQYRQLPEEEWTYLTAPALIDDSMWEVVQAKLASNKALRGGNPKRARMLSGRVLCPVCGGGMQAGPKSSGGRIYYACGRHRKSRDEIGTSVCHASLYEIAVTEQAVMAAVEDACTRPEAIAAAVAAYAGSQEKGLDATEVRHELNSIDRMLKELADQEAATVAAQVRGIMAGASADAYAVFFADIAAKRKDLEDRRGQLTTRLNMRRLGRKSPQLIRSDRQKHLIDTREVLTSEDVSGAEKRDLLGTIIEKVVCQKGGADIYFLPGVVGDDTLHCMSRQKAQPLICDALSFTSSSKLCSSPHSVT